MTMFTGKLDALKRALLAASAAIICSAPAFSQDYDDYLGERPERYAMVRHMEGSIKVRKWDYDEELTIGTPLGEGDIIESSGRAVLQLGDGTRVAFGERTRLEIVMLFGDFAGRAQALFRMDYGRLWVASGPQSDAVVKFDMPSGSASLGYRSAAGIEAGADGKAEIKVFAGAVSFRNSRGEINIPSGNRLTINSQYDLLDRIRPFNTYEKTSFELWAGRFMEIARAANNYVPSEIRYFADSLEGHGDWVTVPEVGWCWKPRITLAAWRPYWRGHWCPGRMGMTWVSYDPFGYVTHHYGRWGWSPSFGWYWIPGVFYSPAWVAWRLTDGFFGWAPLGYRNHPVYWGHAGWRHDCWNVIDVKHIHRRNIYAHTLWDKNMGGRFPAHQPNRPIVSPWRRGPLVISRKEFADPSPSLFRSALTPEVTSQRLRDYESQAGKAAVLRREAGASGRGLEAAPFEDQAARRPLAERPVLRQPLRGSEVAREGRPAPGPDSGLIGGRSAEPRQPSVQPPARPAEPRQPSVQPPSRPAEPRQPSRSEGTPSRQAEPRQPSRSAEPSQASGSSSASRPASPPPASKPSPAPERSAGSKR
jgi:hypothetical protein